MREWLDTNLPEWLIETFDDKSAISWNVLAIRLALALVLGISVTLIYRRTRNAANISPSFPATLVLLTVLIAIVTQVIGNNVARAFSLVGALSIVRFRTVVRDTKDTAFVIFAVVVGMAIGAGQLAVALCGLTAVGTAAFIYRDSQSKSLIGDRQLTLRIRMGWTAELETLVVAIIQKYALQVELAGAGTVRKGAAMELAFRVRLLPSTSVTELVAELHLIEGVQEVALNVEVEGT